MIKQTIIAIVALTLLDFVWLNFIAKNAYISGLRPLLRLNQNGSLSPIFWPLILVYLALAAGIVVFVIPRAGGVPLHALLFGALFGFLVYAIYDFTNYGIITLWQLPISLLDIAWGTVLSGLASLIVALLS